MRALCLRRVQAAGEVRRAGRVAGGKEEKRREGEDVFGWDARGLSVRCRGWGRVRSFGRGAWVEWKVQRDKKRGILGGPVCSGEGSSTANRVGQQMASRHREQCPFK